MSGLLDNNNSFEKSLIHKDLICIDIEAKDREDLLNHLVSKLYEGRYVCKGYIDDVLEREKIFPTGLETKGCNVAIPHADSRNILKDGIVIATLKEPIGFSLMGMESREVYVDIIFLLGIKQDHKKIESLKKIMGIMSEEETLLWIKDCKSAEDIYEKLKKRFN